MFKIFTDGERYEVLDVDRVERLKVLDVDRVERLEVLDVDRVERLCVDFRELRYGEGKKAVLGVFLAGGNSAFFLLDELEKGAEGAFLRCLAKKLNEYDYATEMIDLKSFVTSANKLIKCGYRAKRGRR